MPEAAPMSTSVVSEKFTPGLRSISARIGVAARSSARTVFREPLTARPIGVRMASTMTASGIFGTAPARGLDPGGYRAEGCGVPGRYTDASQPKPADALLVPPQVVGELVTHGAPDLLGEQCGIVTEVAGERVAEDQDAVVEVVTDRKR